MGWTPGRFRGELRARAALEGKGVPPEALEAAAEEFLSRGEHESEHVSPALMRARALDATRHEERTPPLPSTPIFERLAEQWRETLEASARWAREVLFDSSDPPWTPDRWPEAASWIEEAFEKQEARYKGRDPNLMDIDGLEPEERIELGRLVMKMQNYAGVPVTVDPRRQYVHYWASGEGGAWKPRRILARGGPLFAAHLARERPLPFLAQRTEELGRGIDVPPAAVTAFLLTGEPLPLRRASVSWQVRYLATEAGQVPAPHVTIRLNAPDMTNADFRKIRAEVARTWAHVLRNRDTPTEPVPRGPRLTRADKCFLDLARAVGGIPEEPTAEFWEAMLRAWTEEAPAGCTPPGTADALRVRYHRLQEKAPLLNVQIPQWEDSHA